MVERHIKTPATPAIWMYCVMILLTTHAMSADAQNDDEPGNAQIEVRIDMDAIQVLNAETFFQPAAPYQLASPQDPDAQIPDALKVEFGRNLNLLNSESWAERNEAADWFRTVQVPKEVFEALIQADYLTPEQRAQLVSVLRDRVLTRGSGAIGIQMMGARNGWGIQVSRVLPGMPAEGILKSGDEITHINGQLVESQRDFTPKLAPFAPGETVTLTVQRPIPDENNQINEFGQQIEYEEIEVDIVLTDDGRLDDEAVNRNLRRRIDMADEIVRQMSPMPIVLRVPDPMGDAMDDPILRDLKLELDAFVDSKNPDTREKLIASWKQKREDLRRAILEPNLSPDERRRRQALYQQYVKLLPSGI